MPGPLEQGGQALPLSTGDPFGGEMDGGGPKGLPTKLSGEICQGILGTMKLDYAVAMSHQGGVFWISAAYPADMEVEEDDGDEDFEGPWEDEWRLEPDGRMIRIHRPPAEETFRALLLDGSTLSISGHPRAEARPDCWQTAHGENMKMIGTRRRGTPTVW